MRIDIRQTSISPRQAMAFGGATALVAAGALAATFGADLTAGMCLVCAAIAAFLGATEERFADLEAPPSTSRRVAAPAPPRAGPKPAAFRPARLTPDPRGYGLRWASFPPRPPGACSKWPRTGGARGRSGPPA